MTIEDLFSRIQEPMFAWHLHAIMPWTLKLLVPDRELTKEGADECFRAVYDTLREFEDECVKRGEFRATQYKDGVCKDCGGGINSHKYPCSAT